MGGPRDFTILFFTGLQGTFVLSYTECSMLSTSFFAKDLSGIGSSETRRISRWTLTSVLYGVLIGFSFSGMGGL